MSYVRYYGHLHKKIKRPTLGNLMTLCVTAGNVDDRKPVQELCEQVR
jgi:hypothetical protein